MKNFIVFALFTFSFFAHGELIDTIPDFYYWDDAEGEVVQVHACYGEDGDFDCSNVVEVDKADWAQLSENLSRELGSRAYHPVVKNPFIGTGFVFSVIGMFKMSMDIIPISRAKAGMKVADVLRYPKLGRRLGVGGIVLMGAGLIYVAATQGLKSSENSPSKAQAQRQLLNQLSQGMNVEGPQQGLEIFTDFLNEFGRPAV